MVLMLFFRFDLIVIVQFLTENLHIVLLGEL